MKKAKLVIFTFLILTLMVMPTSAKKITSIEELGKIIENIEPDAYSAYIIGKHVFTNENGKLSTQDIMAGATSINIDGPLNKEQIKNKMNIYTIENTTSWGIKKNLVGSDTLTISPEHPLDIKMIDYNYIAEESIVSSISPNIAADFKNKLLQSDFENNNFNEELTFTNIGNNTYEVKGLLLKKDDTITGLESNKTSYYMAFALNIPELNSNSTLTIEEENGYKKVFNSADFVISSDKGTAIIWPVNSQSSTKKITITLDIDGDKDGYENEYGITKYYIVWDEELKFQKDSNLSMNVDISTENASLIENKLNYKRSAEDTYKLTFDNNKTFTLSDDVIYQSGPNKHFGESDPKGYYVLLNITDPNFIVNKTIITVPCKSCTATNNKKDILIDSEDKTLLLLMALNNNGDPKEFEITVDLDGAGHEYEPVTYKVDYNGVNFKQRTYFTMEISNDGVQESYNYKGDSSTITLKDNSLSGIVQLTKGVINTSLGSEEGKLTNYYVPVKLNIDGKDDGTTIKVNGIETKDTTLLLPVSQSQRLDEKFIIEVDRDGENGNYIKKEIELTYKNLEFQSQSSATFNTNLNDLSFDSTWNKALQDSKKLSFENNGNILNLKGDVKEQKINGEKKFYIAFQVNVRKYDGQNPTIILNTAEDSGSIIEEKEFPDAVPFNYKKIFLYELPTEDNKEFTVTVDLDGNGVLYNAETYTIKIDYSKVNRINLYTINFADNVKDTIEAYANEHISVENLENPNEYLEFIKWKNQKDKSDLDLNDYVVKEDITVMPYYELKLQNYINDYVTKYINKDITLTGQEHEYTFNIKSQKLNVNEFSDTQLAEKLKYILTDLKAKSITINSTEVNDENKINEELTKLIKPDSNTYDDLFNNIDGKITINFTVNESDSIFLQDADKSSYTFNIDADFRVVDSKEELIKALTAGIKKIYIAGEIDLGAESLEINDDDVVIEGNNNTIKSSNEEYVIKTSSNATLNKLIIDGQKAAHIGILVNNGNLAVNNVTVNNTKVGSDNVTSALEVNSSATVETSNLLFPDESYDQPAIRALGESNVTLNRAKYNSATAKIYEEVVTYETLKASGNSEQAQYGDQKKAKEDYNYKHYYINADNETKWILLDFKGDFNITRVKYDFYRYVPKDTISSNWETYSKTMLPYDIDSEENNIQYLTKYTKNGYSYDVNNVCEADLGEAKCAEITNLSTLPVPTNDSEYIVKLKYKGLQEGVVEAVDGEDLRTKVANPEYRKIILKSNTTYDLGEEPLEIDRSLSIGGTLSGANFDKTSVIKGKIIINAENVNITQLTIEGNDDNVNANDNIITVNQKGFYLYQTDIKAPSTGQFKTAIYYDVESPKTTIYFTNFTDNNSLKSFVEFNKSIGKDESGFKTELLGNTFNGGSKMTSYIKLDTLDNETHAIDISIKQSHFIFKNNDAYALEIVKTPAGTKPINFYLGIPSLYGSDLQKVRVKINVTEDLNDATSMTFTKAEKFNNLEIHYFQDGTDQGMTNPYNKNATILNEEKVLP